MGKKPKEEEKIVIAPAVLPTKPEPEAEAPPSKPKISDEYAEKDKKPKEEEKIIITPAVLPTKPEEESSESEEEPEPEPAKKKLSKADLNQLFKSRLLLHLSQLPHEG